MFTSSCYNTVTERLNVYPEQVNIQVLPFVLQHKSYQSFLNEYLKLKNCDNNVGDDVGDDVGDNDSHYVSDDAVKGMTMLNVVLKTLLMVMMMMMIVMVVL